MLAQFEVLKWNSDTNNLLAVDFGQVYRQQHFSLLYSHFLSFMYTSTHKSIEALSLSLSLSLCCYYLYFSHVPARYVCTCALTCIPTQVSFLLQHLSQSEGQLFSFSVAVYLFMHVCLCMSVYVNVSMCVYLCMSVYV